MKDSDSEAVLRIYGEGLLTGHATFQTNVPSWKEWDDSHIKDLRYVFEISGQVAGWTALSPVSSRCVYGGVAEVSIYVGEIYRGRKVGFSLLTHLIKESEAKGYWTLQAGIFPENKNSIALHLRCGFKLIGVREKIGRLSGAWRDTILLERRSSTVGID